VLLKPKKGTQGREMHPKTKIVVALLAALALAVSASAPSAALAGGPLLSGYGGPGAGEQAILGSTLLGGSGSGGSSGGSGGGGRSGGTGTGVGGSGGSAREKAGATASTGASGGGPVSHPATTGTVESTAAQTGARRGHRRLGGSAAGQGGGAAGRAGVSAYVYPSTMRVASYDSPVLGISVDDLLALVVTIATLTLLGVLTIRLGRLQA
jgi:hypothetical protein